MEKNIMEKEKQNHQGFEESYGQLSPFSARRPEPSWLYGLAVKGGSQSTWPGEVPWGPYPFHVTRSPQRDSAGSPSRSRPRTNPPKGAGPKSYRKCHASFGPRGIAAPSLPKEELEKRIDRERTKECEVMSVTLGTQANLNSVEEYWSDND